MAKRKPLNGTTNTSPAGRLSLKKVGNDMKGPGMILAGILAGALADKYLLSKISAIQEKEGSKMSKFIKPVLIAATGLIGRQFVPASLKTLLDGVSVYGGVKTVNAATNKDVMTGLSGLEPYRELMNTPPTQQEYVLNMLNQGKQQQFETV